ncbi:hypothetical protein TRICI_006443 [Trichomonascus ciferrii]|uniref:Uncharacterized protein n=1 Tax=Trichomonascus ciferrii TaxID=44093 RepID=A0A642UH07_9ASCO|nr:hypothetical protein TRICI_006443 [Trichomonascus ciferrii]
MKRQRPFKDGHGAKRRLISSLESLSLTSTGNNRSASNDNDLPDYMDTSSPNTVFIPSIDRFLLDDEEEFEPIPNRLLAIPPSLVQNSSDLHFFQRPTLELLPYEPPHLIIWKHLWSYVPQLDSDIDMDDPYSFANTPDRMDIDD